MEVDQAPGSWNCLKLYVCLKKLTLHSKVKTGLKMDYEKNWLRQIDRNVS